MVVKFSKDPPAIWPELEKKFGVSWGEGITIAYKDTIHSPDELPPDVVVHEIVHLDQQARFEGGPEGFVRRYINDAQFREDMEIEAYGKQWTFVKDHFKKDVTAQNQALEILVDGIKQPYYQIKISRRRARKLIVESDLKSRVVN